jgi:hypothetical protein
VPKQKQPSQHKGLSGGKGFMIKYYIEVTEERLPCLRYGLSSPICQRQCLFIERSIFYFGTTLSNLSKGRVAAVTPASPVAEKVRS